MNKIVDHAEYQPNVPYQQLDQQTMDQNIYQTRPDELEQIVKDINIPDQVEFEHKFELDVNSCCGYGDITQSSEFDIQGIGKLGFRVKINVKCALCCCLNCFWWCRCKWDIHAYPKQIYILKTDKLHLEFWPGSVGRVYANGKNIFEFVQTFPNPCDVFNQHCCTSYPKLKISSPIDKNYKLILRPEINNCPESSFAFYGCFSCFDIFTTSKNYYVDGLTQGKCQIINTRTACEACARICGMQGRCCKYCPLIDYPRFAVQFDNVRKIDKIAIIIGLVHISFYNQWVTYDNYLYIKYFHHIVDDKTLIIL